MNRRIVVAVSRSCLVALVVYKVATELNAFELMNDRLRCFTLMPRSHQSLNMFKSC